MRKNRLFSSDHWIRQVVDGFLLALTAVILLSIVLPLPVSGGVHDSFNVLTYISLSALFFIHGAKLSRQAIIQGAINWRLHLMVFLSTFVVFPLVGFLFEPVFSPLFTGGNELFYFGILYLCFLPSTVQSSIAFTSIAKGNVSAAVCSASLSNFLGIFITPFLVNLFFSGTSGVNAAIDLKTMTEIILQILLPFVAGHIARQWIAGWIDRQKTLANIVDNGTILLVVYMAFSDSMQHHYFENISLSILFWVVVIDVSILTVLLFFTYYSSKYLRFNREDRIAILFCGSKKTLASGLPMARVIFAGIGASTASLVLPLIIFHQIQLVVCSFIARHYKREAESCTISESLSSPLLPGVVTQETDK